MSFSERLFLSRPKVSVNCKGGKIVLIYISCLWPSSSPGSDKRRVSLYSSESEELLPLIGGEGKAEGMLGQGGSSRPELD